MKEYSNKRILLFNLISALELDLRDFIHINRLSIELFREKIDARIKNTIYDTNDYSSRLQFLDFGEYYDVIKTVSISPENKKIFNEFLNELKIITPIRNRVMHTRPLLEDDFEIAYSFCKTCSKYSHFIALQRTIDLVNNVDTFSIEVNYQKNDTNDLYIDDAIENNLPLVDYDDTGFVGRREKKKELLKKIKSSHPIISVIGNGGIGKTSTVLSCIYDVIDKSDFPFEKVLWVTLKTKSLQDGEFKEIKNSIKSFAECIEKNNILEKEAVTNIDNLLFYMECYKTLLVLDNLETVDIVEVKKLFEEIPAGSKIVITSRIGIREYESRLLLGPFDIDEAVYYFRRLVKTYSVKLLSKIPDEEVKKYVAKLYYSPLCIKWFVINVAKGNSPSIVVSNQEELVEFCLSNVFDKLSEQSKKVINIMLLKGGSCSLAELMYVNGNDYGLTIECVYELCACNFIEAQPENAYLIPEFAAKYLRNKFNLKSEESTEIQRRINQLNGKIENLQGDVLSKRRTPLTLSPKTVNEKIATVYMQSFIEANEQNDFDKMEKCLDLAQKSSPNFADIYTVAGFCYGKVKQNEKAIECFKNALSCCNDSDKPFVCSYYSLFLTNNTTRYDEAFELIDYALSQHPDDPYFLANKARTLKYTKRFNEALSIIDNIIVKNNDLDFNLKRSLIVERIDIEARKFDLTMDKDERKTIFVNIFSRLKEIEYEYYCTSLYKTMLKSFKYAIRVDNKTILKTILKEYCDRFGIFMLFVADKKTLEEDVLAMNCYLSQKIDITKSVLIFPKRESGVIGVIKKEKGYGFIYCKNSTNVFFHFSMLSFDSRKVYENMAVTFFPVFKDGKWQANDIESDFYDENE